MAGWPIPQEYLALVAASLVGVIAFLLAYQAKRITMLETAAALERKQIVDLSAATGPETLEIALAAVFTDAADRRVAANAIHRFLTDGGARPPSAPNVGALSRIRIPAAELQAGGSGLRARLARASPGTASIALFTTSDIVTLKPSIIVRNSDAVASTVRWALLLYLVSFYGVVAYWRWRGFQGDPWLLPIAHLLTGLGLAAMLALQDPLRDRLLVADFSIGVSLGCIALAAMSTAAYRGTALERLALLPLLAAIAISAMLLVFGSGPGTSDAKVNLFGMQPVEVIRLLLVLYLAGYFASRWEFIRQLREEQFGGLELPKRFRVPRYDHVLPLIVGVALALLLFFLQKDLGPALVFGCLFLALYGVARNEIVLVTAGVVLMLGGFIVAYLIGYPSTIVTRVAMWRSPWENAMRGGDHVAQALWALASGGPIGAGLGLGEPSLIPEAHTDMVLAGLGEELGFAGIAAIALLYAVFVYRGLDIARRSTTDYTFFLALGLTLSVALPLLLISGGILGVFPLSGVATPFLSYGKSSMIANCAVLGMLYGISREVPPGRDRESAVTSIATQPFLRATRIIAMAIAVLGSVIVARAMFVQVIADEDTMVASSLAPQADGVLRYQDNPRLRKASTSLPRGALLDRRGLPLAVTSCADLKKSEAALRQLGALEPCDERVRRHYPLAGYTYHLLGDARTRTDWAATNTSFEERDHESRLRGFDDGEQVVERVDPRTDRTIRTLKHDYSALVEYWRNRHRPSHPDVRALVERARDLRVTIDARLQTRVSRALDQHLASSGRDRGAVVVLDAETGEVLALVNAPRPRVTDAASLGIDAPLPPDDPAWFDRARYGIYPPGSTFKLVTAAAALRKDPALAEETFMCRRLPDGRIGARIPGWTRPIRDDELDRVPHGAVNLRAGIEQSCNAYFAQLAMRIGASSLHDTGRLFEIALAQPDTADRLRDTLPQAGYGQGEVQVTPFKMARIVASIANGGRMPYGRWVNEPGDRRDRPPVQVMTPAVAAQIASYMRGVVLRGTARSLGGISPAVAGKTGTAEINDAPSHAWFAGFAPYGATKGRRIAFAILIENGGYGGRTAAPLAGELVRAARDYGLLTE
jgi:cell division protein FtsW (lipid II flippase)/cell division protein FtsI/penicillin-binding protein 2